MDFNATIDLIINDLEEARKIIDDLKSYPGVPALQIELAKAKCKSAGEVIALLKEKQEPETISKEIFQAIDDLKKTETVPIVKEPEKKETKQIISEPGKKVTDKIITEPEKAEDIPQKTEKELRPETPKKPAESEKEITGQHAKKQSDSSILADTFSYLSSRLNEQMVVKKSDGDISEMLKTKQLISLSEAIGVNDRFMYIREIFNGNREAYNEALTKLEKVENLSDARAVIMSYKGDNEECEAVEQLINLVKRKLPHNE
jgi:hypothetical protein